MPHDSYQQFVILFFLGFGLVSAAVVNLALRHASISRRGLLSGGACIFTMFGCWAFERNPLLLPPLALLLVSGVLFAMLFTTSLPGWFAERSRRPLAAWRFCGVIGAVILAASARTYEEHDQADITRNMVEIETLEDLDRSLAPTRFRSMKTQLVTDLGAVLEAWAVIEPRPLHEQTRLEDAFFRERWNRDLVLRTGPAGDATNCFGWIFTGGKHWIPTDSAEQILKQNGYSEVETPSAGDLVAYRRHGFLVHVAVVRYLADGRPAFVEGKWGGSGAFLHAVDQSPYGREFEYLRSPRAGHLLKGLREDEPQVEERTE
jgi:hypothetical protein